MASEVMKEKGVRAMTNSENTLLTVTADHTYTILRLLGFSPPIGSKARKIYSAIQTERFNKGV